MESEHPESLKGELLSTEAVNGYAESAWGLKLPATTLSKLRSLGGGPAFIKIGTRVVYEKSAIDEWVQSRMSSRRFTSTSDESVGADNA